MCGITGAVWSDPIKALAPQTLRQMTDALRHRGPDDAGEHVAALQHRPGRDALPGVALGHRRLAIIDLAGGRQPLANEDDSVWVVCNGEIYNYAALRRRLEGAGHRFRTASDTETLVHLYEDHGPAMLDHLVGMFALAIWDGRRGELLLARDRLGKKPLVYRHEAGRLLFASELKALLAVPGVPRELDPQALDEYLTYQYVPHPRSIFRGFCKLPPGHLAVYRDDRLEVRPYWQPDFAREENLRAADYAAQLRATLTAAVRDRLQSEVPLGAFLSGGIDSTIIVGLMRSLGVEPLRTFTIGFAAPEYDETRYARAAADKFQTIHAEFCVEPQAVEVLPRLVWHYDEPLADSSAIPTWHLAELTRRHVTVALSGDGGDELFLGYPRYTAAWLAAGIGRVPGLRRLAGADFWQRLPASTRRDSLRRRWKRFAAALRLPAPRRYVEWISIFGEAQRAELYSDGFLQSLPDADPAAFVAGALARAAGRAAPTAAALADLVTYLPCDLMAKVDTATMAHGLECRCPMLDHRVVELAARMPQRLKFRWGRGKRVLREAFADLLPPGIQCRGKMGFGVPLDHWFRNELRDFARDVLCDPRTQQRGLFRPAAVARLLDDHQANRADHSHRLWALLFLELWSRQWLDV